MDASNALPASLDLTGRRALVTGGSRGIGRAIAITLAARGAAVAVNYARGEAAAREVVAAIEDAGGKAVAVGFDVSDADAVAAGFKQVTEALGGLDILVNNAGISIDALLMRAKEEDWETLQRVNLRGTLLCSKAATRSLLRAKASGRIINITSVVGEQGNAGQTMYAATKAGVIGMTKSLAKEVADTEIRINSIAPAVIQTPMLEQVSQETIDYMVSKIPVGRTGKTEEVAALVHYLSSDECGFATGACFDISGGRATY